MDVEYAEYYKEVMPILIREFVASFTNALRHTLHTTPWHAAAPTTLRTRGAC